MKRRTFLGLLAGTAAAAGAGGAFAFLRQEQFGALPEGDAVRRVRLSPHYVDGEFRNIIPRPILSDGSSFAGALLRSLVEKKTDPEPPAPVPSRRPDFRALASSEDLLVWLGHSSFFLRLGGKRLLIDDTIRVPGTQDIFAIGDCSSYTPPGEQRPLPTLAPVALAEGELAAKNILHDVRGEEMEHLHYKSKGVMAIIGNSEAVMEAGPLRGRGFLAWAAWLWIHLLTKAGFHANISVTFKWIFNYLSGTRLGRLITRPELQGLPESIKNAPEAKDAGAEKQAS